MFSLPPPVSCFLPIMAQDLPLFQIPEWFGRLCRINSAVSDLLPSQKGMESDS